MYCGGQDVYLPQTSEARSSSRRSISKYLIHTVRALAAWHYHVTAVCPRPVTVIIP